MIHPILLFMVAPQPLRTYLPYGAVMKNSSTNTIAANISQVARIALNISRSFIAVSLAAGPLQPSMRVCRKLFVRGASDGSSNPIQLFDG